MAARQATADAWYFSRFEERMPDAPAAPGRARSFVFQSLAVLALALGASYLGWRWTESLNPDALGFSIVVAAAETIAWAGAALFFLSIWRIEDPPVRPPPRTVNEIVREPLVADRPLRVDVLVTTYDESVELVRLSVRDAKRLAYPHPIDLRVHVLDDGRRPPMREMAREEGVRYIARETNHGFKAGNLKNAIEQTDGDLFVVCDADTRPLPALLEETLGYFRDPDVAWVQTPQWFYDIDRGTPLPEWLASRARLGRAGRAAGRSVERIIGPVAIGADPFGEDPRAFFDVVQRGRNWCNAAFCCGAGSVHRREAVMETALRRFGAQVAASVRPLAAQVPDPELRADLSTALASQAARRLELEPFQFHVSEDLYTSILLHSDERRRWKSVYHPRALTRMLSPQDLAAWRIQRFKYASGTLDIALHANPLRLRGLTGWQKLMYASTIYGYLAPLWVVPLMVAPLVFFFSGVTPVRAFDASFWAHALPFLAASRLALWAGTWGVPTCRIEQYHFASFWLHLEALVHVLARKPLRFNVTPKVRASCRSIALVAPHLVLLGAMALGIVWGAVRLAGPADAQVGAYAANVFWTIHNAWLLAPLVAAALAPRRAEGMP
jgi:cellulose synthase (UDP-forming)